MGDTLGDAFLTIPLDRLLHSLPRINSLFQSCLFFHPIFIGGTGVLEEGDTFIDPFSLVTKSGILLLAFHL